MIGVGKTGWAVSPPAEPYVRISRVRLSSQSLPQSGLTRQSRGRRQIERPLPGEVSTGPAPMRISPAWVSVQFPLLEQNAS